MNDVKHFDSRNPIWETSRHITFQRERISDTIQDGNGNEFKVDVEYHYYRHDGQSRVVFCIVKTNHACDAAELKESVQNLVDFFEGNTALFETQVEILTPIK